MTRRPQVNAKELTRVLRANGFVEARQSGSHLTLRHPVRKISVTVPMHTGKDLGRGLVARILKDAGIEGEEL